MCPECGEQSQAAPNRRWKRDGRRARVRRLRLTDGCIETGNQKVLGRAGRVAQRLTSSDEKRRKDVRGGQSANARKIECPGFVAEVRQGRIAGAEEELVDAASADQVDVQVDARQFADSGFAAVNEFAQDHL